MINNDAKFRKLKRKVTTLTSDINTMLNFMETVCTQQLNTSTTIKAMISGDHTKDVIENVAKFNVVNAANILERVRDISEKFNGK